jgi:hypothetical protein
MRSTRGLWELGRESRAAFKNGVLREMGKVIRKHLRGRARPAEPVDSLAEGIVDLLRRRRPA